MTDLTHHIGYTLLSSVVVLLYTVIIYVKARQDAHREDCRICERERRRLAYKDRARVRFSEVQRN